MVFGCVKSYNILNAFFSSLLLSSSLFCIVVKESKIVDIREISNSDEAWVEDIMAAELQPPYGKSIFFHETSDPVTNTIHLTEREGCSIESAAILNPATHIFVIFISKRYKKVDSVVLRKLSTYPNIHFRSVDLLTYTMSTPVEDWILEEMLTDSRYVVAHTSDFLRFLTLYKWGGTYLDLDIVVMQSLENLQPNFAGAESNTHVAAGVMNFDFVGTGHDIVATMLREFIINFDGSDWGSNGPGVITRVLQSICQTSSPSLMTRERCSGFKVHDVRKFYAIPWKHWYDFFDPLKTEVVLNQTHDSIIVHIWNRHSGNLGKRTGSTNAYMQLAGKFCPMMKQGLT